MKINLYRKYRPKLFSEIVGQDTMVKALLNAIKQNSFSHAYLFTGPRGTGKTTTARIIAKSLNCLDNKNGEPCLICKNCVSIEENKFFDIIEIDAASNRNIDDFRELREKMVYAPAEGKYKVYIIDEVHMLTTHASNAFLKMLEEPPEYVVFILATTDPQKIIPTIISRCQRYDFKSVTLLKIAQRLKEIIKYENEKGKNYNVEEEAYTIIAGLANGGMRDAISLLEKVISYCETEITVKNISDFLSIAEITHIEKITDHIKENNGSDILKIIDDLIYEGKDITQFLIQLVEYFRDLIFIKNYNEHNAKEKFVFFDSLIKNKDKFEINELIDLLKIFEQTLANMKRSEHPRLNLELGLLNSIKRSENIVKEPDFLKEIPKKVKKNTLEQSHKNIETPNIESTIIKSEIPKEKIVRSIPKTTVTNENINNTLTITVEYLKNNWNKLCDKIMQKHLFTGPLISCAKVMNIENNIITIGYEKNNKFQMEQIKDNRFKKNAEEVLSECLNRPISLMIIEADTEIKKEINTKDILNDPLVKKVVEVFNGKIKSINNKE